MSIQQYLHNNAIEDSPMESLLELSQANLLMVQAVVTAVAALSIAPVLMLLA